jgi:hypothetical protein|tara:strand:+ start:4006 stop:4596 length:591 start_codon:yes stop_codon:yes gene_type:complete
MTKVRNINFGPLLVVTATSLLLAACTTGVAVTGPTYLSSIYSQDMLLGVSAQGGMALKVKGAPFTSRQPGIADQIAEIFTNNHFGPSFQVYATPPAKLKEAYRTFVVFNPDPGLSGDAVCAEKSDPAKVAPEAGKVRLLAVFCEYQVAQTSTVGRVQADGPSDPRYIALLQQVSHDLWPPLIGDMNRSNNQAEWPD